MMDPTIVAHSTDRTARDHVTQTSVPTFPPGRYGRRRDPARRRRWLPYVLVVPVVAGAVWLTVVLYGKYGTNDYRASLESYGSISDTQVTLRFSVHKPGGAPAVCRVHAQDRSMAEVGYAEVRVPAGKDVEVTYTLTTSRRAYGVDILGCQAG
jgi:hypothetical protein